MHQRAWGDKRRWVDLQSGVSTRGDGWQGRMLNSWYQTKWLSTPCCQAQLPDCHITARIYVCIYMCGQGKCRSLLMTVVTR